MSAAATPHLPSHLCEAAGCISHVTCEFRRTAEAWTPEKHLAFEFETEQKISDLRGITSNDYANIVRDRRAVRDRELLGHKPIEEAEEQVRAHIWGLALKHQPPMPLAPSTTPASGSADDMDSSLSEDDENLSDWIYEFNEKHQIPGRLHLTPIDIERRRAEAIGDAYTMEKYAAWIQQNPPPPTGSRHSSAMRRWETRSRREVLGDKEQHRADREVMQMFRTECQDFIASHPAPSVAAFQRMADDNNDGEKGDEDGYSSSTSSDDEPATKGRGHKRKHAGAKSKKLARKERRAELKLETSRHAEAVAFRKWADELPHMGLVGRFRPYRKYDDVLDAVCQAAANTPAARAERARKQQADATAAREMVATCQRAFEDTRKELESLLSEQQTLAERIMTLSSRRVVEQQALEHARAAAAQHK